LELKSIYVPDSNVSKSFIENVYKISRKKYNRNLKEARKEVEKEHTDVVEKVSEFVEPII